MNKVNDMVLLEIFAQLFVYGLIIGFILDFIDKMGGL